MNKEWVKNQVQRFDSRTRKFITGRFRQIMSFPDELICYLLYGCSPDDYFRYEFYRKSGYERNTFITYKRSKKLISRNNASDDAVIFENKALFNERFSEFLKRSWIDMEGLSPDEFRIFAERHGEVLLKPRLGGQGKGIVKISVSDLDHINYSDFRDYIAEEILVQHPLLAELNSSSLNTVRVMTYMKEIVGCALRIGEEGAFVDNMHSRGISAHLDTEKGIVDAPCIDREMNRYLFHPHSGKNLLGFQIPHWDKVKETALTASSLVPSIQYVGWDVAILPDDVAIIEGNHDPGHAVMQMVAQTGLYGKIREIQRQDHLHNNR